MSGARRKRRSTWSLKRGRNPSPLVVHPVGCTTFVFSTVSRTTLRPARAAKAERSRLDCGGQNMGQAARVTRRMVDMPLVKGRGWQ